MLLFKFRPGTHSLNEVLGRHRGKKDMTECILCHAYKDSREELMVKLRAILREVLKALKH